MSRKFDRASWPPEKELDSLETIFYDHSHDPWVFKAPITAATASDDSTATMSSVSVAVPYTPMSTYPGTSQAQTYPFDYKSKGASSNAYYPAEPNHASAASSSDETLPEETPYVTVRRKRQKHRTHTYRFDNGAGYEIETVASDWKPAMVMFQGYETDCLAYTGKKSGKVWFTWYLPEA